VTEEQQKELMHSVHSPTDISNYTMEIVTTRQTNKHLALHTGVGTLDRYMRPVLPGEVIVVQANTGQGKTSFMQIWARAVVKQLQERQNKTDIVVYLSYETLVEEMGLYDLAAMTGLDSSDVWHGDITDGQFLSLKSAAMRRTSMPLWIIGRSMKRKRQYDLPLSKVQDALHLLEDREGLTPAIIFLDYIQAAPMENKSIDRRVAVIEIADKIKELAMTCGCPVIAAAQAKVEEFQKEGVKLPGTYGAQESSRVAQDADKVISLWYPKATEGLGSTIKLGQNAYEVTRDLLIIGIRKQRHAEAGQVFPVRFDPARSTMTSWDERPTEEVPF
jgi:replicative DNA helicase